MSIAFPASFSRPHLSVIRGERRVTVTIFTWQAVLIGHEDEGIRGDQYIVAPGAEIMKPFKADLYDALSLLAALRHSDARLAGEVPEPCALHVSPQAAVKLLFTGTVAQDRLDQCSSDTLPNNQPVLLLPLGRAAEADGIQEIHVSPAYYGMAFAPLR